MQGRPAAATRPLHCPDAQGRRQNRDPGAHPRAARGLPATNGQRQAAKRPRHPTAGPHPRSARLRRSLAHPLKPGSATGESSPVKKVRKSTLDPDHCSSIVYPNKERAAVQSQESGDGLGHSHLQLLLRLRNERFPLGLLKSLRRLSPHSRSNEALNSTVSRSPLAMIASMFGACRMSSSRLRTPSALRGRSSALKQASYRGGRGTTAGDRRGSALGGPDRLGFRDRLRLCAGQHRASRGPSARRGCDPAVPPAKHTTGS